MPIFDREDIHLISRHSNWSEDNVVTELNNHVYNGKSEWNRFLKLSLLSLGVAFTVSGIIFFFAYNWADLHKFVKLLLIGSLLIIILAVVLFSKFDELINKIILSGACFMVGILFAIFGQIYQTGANAYDFFLGWTVFIALWVIISDFPLLWLFFILLIDTTFNLYTEQVARDWSSVFVFTILFILNSVFIIMALLRNQFSGKEKFPSWYFKTLTLSVVVFATIGIVIGFFDSSQGLVILLLLMSMAYYAGIYYGLKQREGFYLATISFSVIIIISALIIKIFENEISLLFTFIFVIASVTCLIKYLIEIQKKWANEKSN